MTNKTPDITKSRVCVFTTKMPDKVKNTPDKNNCEIELQDLGRKYEISAAIDFGTTYSGVAYSYRGEENNVYAIRNWPDGSIDSKIPTAILFGANEKFIAFGQDAVDKFIELADEKDEKDVYFFHRFKMQLYGKAVTKKLIIRDASGKTMIAIKVFTAAISYLKQRLLDSINEHFPTLVLSNSSVQWVLTVPAIWDDASKQFMREAAENAGLRTRDLTIALEPECASMYCFNANNEKMVSTAAHNKRKRNVTHLILDSGGGTVDITVHQLQNDGSVKEMHKASGGAWGGTKIDELFVEYLCTLFTRENVEKVKKESPSEWEQLIKDFETMKKKIRKKSLNDSIFVHLPDNFDIQNFKRLSDKIKKGAVVKASRLKIPQTVLVEMISNVSNRIVDHVNELLNEHLKNTIDFIVMVGGFSNSDILVSNIKTFVAASRGIPVFVPEEAELAVMKGAVKFGWNPWFVSVRKSRKTYGLCVDKEFLSATHDVSRLYIDDFGCRRCRDCFDVLVTMNEDLNLNETKKREYATARKYDRHLELTFYCTDNANPKYIDEQGVVQIGRVLVPMPVTSDDLRLVEIDVIFGDTEIRVKARDQKSGKEAQAAFDFL